MNSSSSNTRPAARVVAARWQVGQSLLLIAAATVLLTGASRGLAAAIADTPAPPATELVAPSLLDAPYSFAAGVPYAAPWADEPTAGPPAALDGRDIAGSPWRE